MSVVTPTRKPPTNDVYSAALDPAVGVHCNLCNEPAAAVRIHGAAYCPAHAEEVDEVWQECARRWPDESGRYNKAISAWLIYTYLRVQECSHEEALELWERKLRNPQLQSAIFKGRSLFFRPQSPENDARPAAADEGDFVVNPERRAALLDRLNNGPHFGSGRCMMLGCKSGRQTMMRFGIVDIEYCDQHSEDEVRAQMVEQREIVSLIPACQDEYDRLRCRGLSHNLAANFVMGFDLKDLFYAREQLAELVAAGKLTRIEEMLLLQQPPGCAGTDRAFLEGTENGRQFQGGKLGTQMADYYRRVAQSKGQNTTGKVYLSQLARYPGDPEAFVSDRSDVKRICEQRGLGCEGSVKVKAREQPVVARTEVADVLVERYTKERLLRDPELRRKDVREVKAETREKLKRK